MGKKREEEEEEEEKQKEEEEEEEKEEEGDGQSKLAWAGIILQSLLAHLRHTGRFIVPATNAAEYIKRAHYTRLFTPCLDGDLVSSTRNFSLSNRSLFSNLLPPLTFPPSLFSLPIY